MTSATAANLCFISLPFSLVVLSEEALVVGAASEPVQFNVSSNQTDLPVCPEEPFPLYALERPVSFRTLVKIANIQWAIRQSDMNYLLVNT